MVTVALYFFGGHEQNRVFVGLVGESHASSLNHGGRIGGTAFNRVDRVCEVECFSANRFQIFTKNDIFQELHLSTGTIGQFLQ